jgi:hypothetical protein
MLELEVEKDRELTWQLERLFEITGRVVDAEGQPVTNQAIGLVPHETLTRTDERGEFRIQGVGRSPHSIFFRGNPHPIVEDVPGDTFDLEIVGD